MKSPNEMKEEKKCVRRRIFNKIGPKYVVTRCRCENEEYRQMRRRSVTLVCRDSREDKRQRKKTPIVLSYIFIADIIILIYGI